MVPEVMADSIWGGQYSQRISLLGHHHRTHPRHTLCLCMLLLCSFIKNNFYNLGFSDGYCCCQVLCTLCSRDARRGDPGPAVAWRFVWHDMETGSLARRGRITRGHTPRWKTPSVQLCICGRTIVWGWRAATTSPTGIGVREAAASPPTLPEILLYGIFVAENVLLRSTESEARIPSMLRWSWRNLYRAEYVI